MAASVPPAPRRDDGAGVTLIALLTLVLATAPRSSVSWKNHVDVGAGVIDADYRGHVKVCLFNHADTDFTSTCRLTGTLRSRLPTNTKRPTVQQGDKIAQLIIERISLPDVEGAHH